MSSFCNLGVVDDFAQRAACRAPQCWLGGPGGARSGLKMASRLTRSWLGLVYHDEAVHGTPRTLKGGSLCSGAGQHDARIVCRCRWASWRRGKTTCRQQPGSPLCSQTVRPVPGVGYTNTSALQLPLPCWPEPALAQAEHCICLAATSMRLAQGSYPPACLRPSMHLAWTEHLHVACCHLHASDSCKQCW